MNVFHRVTLQSLRKNKTRTIVTVIGIILSTALICAVMISFSSMMNYAQQYVINSNGKWHGLADSLDYQTFSEIKDNDEISEYTAIKEIGYAEIGSQNDYKAYLYIASLVGENDRMIAINVTDGKYPESADEILLPEHLRTNGHAEYSIGDKLELDIGYRFSDGQKLHQNNPNYIGHYNNGNYEEEMIDEELVPQITRTYTVCGFYERPAFEPFDAPGFTAIVLDDGYSDDTEYQMFFTMKNPKKIYKFLESHDFNSTTNYEILVFMGVMPEFDGMNAMIKSVLAILIALIVFGSVSLIYNAFSISVSERTRQFGLLSSIGATRKQSRKMVFFEAFVVSAVGIPLGVIVGIVGIAITLSAIGDKVNSVTGFNIPMKICVTPLPIITACMIAVVTVMISAFIPSIRATRVTAVEAIRQSKDIKSKNKPVRTPKIVYRVFGLSGMLAQKYFKRNKKKYRSTIMSLFMSIVLFISASAFCEYLIASINTPLGNVYSYDISCEYPCGRDDENVDENLEKQYNAFISDENVTGVSYVIKGHTQGGVETSCLTEEFKSYTDDNMTGGYIQVTFVDDNSFRELLAENNLDESKFMNPDSPLAVTFDGDLSFDYETQKYSKTYMYNTDEFDFSMGLFKEVDGYYLGGFIDSDREPLVLYRSETDSSDTKKIPYSEATYTISLRCGKVLYEKPYWYPYSGNIFSFVYPYSMYEKVTQRHLETYYFTYYITTDDHSATYENIQKQADDLSIFGLYDRIAENERELNLITIIKVFAYGFIVLISLIACANVFNTISTNVNLRRREFAMLRSIGMTNKELRRMMNYECFIYGSKALIFGLPVSFIMTFLIHTAVHNGIENDFFIPWGAVGIAVLSVFAVVFATMLYSMSKIKSDNLIETLKNENM